MGGGGDIRHDVPSTFWLGLGGRVPSVPPCGGAHVLSHGILEGLGLQEQSLGYSGPDKSGTCAMKTVLQFCFEMPLEMRLCESDEF